MKFIDNYVNSKIINQLKLLSTGNNLQYTLLSDENYKMSERAIQYYGDGSTIYKFYKANLNKTIGVDYINKNNFYRVVNTNTMPLMHYPLGKIISQTMANLVFSKTPTISVNSGNKKINLILNKYITDSIDDNDGGKFLQQAVEYESYSGAVGITCTIDKDISNYPIIQIYPKEAIDVERRFGRIISIKFKNIYNHDDKNYELQSIYTPGRIHYELFLDKNGDDKKQVPLNTIPETSSLKEIIFLKNYFDENGKIYQDRDNMIYAVYKENRTGCSDYDNLNDDFAYIDEIYSNMVNYLRKTKPKEYLPDSTCYTDTSGNKIVPADYDRDIIILNDADPYVGEKDRTHIDRDIPQLNGLEDYTKALDNAKLKAIESVGLSPATCGFDTAGANSSALALNIRERVSMRTRSQKLLNWKKALIQLTKIILKFKELQIENDSEEFNQFFVTPTVDIDNYDIGIEFAEYESPTYENMVNSLSTALNSNLISLTEALKRLYPDKTDEELEIMKFEISGQLPDGEAIVNNELNQPDEKDEPENDTDEDN